MKTKFLAFLLLLLLLFSCDDNLSGNKEKNLTIFFINDQHGQLENFAKIKHIADLERMKTNVLLVCSGDMFSGNPVVDNHPQKGFPMIDLMNRCGFAVSVIGNHEFDYGVQVLKERVEQSQFDWVCANVDMQNSGIPEPFEFRTVTVEDIKVTFLGLVETFGKEGDVIPSTHPFRVKDLSFRRPGEIIRKYSGVKEEEGSDLYIALTHLGFFYAGDNLNDYNIAQNHPYFDFIIGGHSHQKIDTVVNEVPIFQSGSYLNYLGKIKLTVKQKEIQNIEFELIDLNEYTEYDAEMKNLIAQYNSNSGLDDVIGYSERNHSRQVVGCFYVDALRSRMNVDLTFQNTGGVRAPLDKGDITRSEIYSISPFNNGTYIFEMTTFDVKNFLIESHSGFYYSGLKIIQTGSAIKILDESGKELSDKTTISVGVNDYIPAVHERLFPESGEKQTMTAAETIISYLETGDGKVDYPECSNYFRYK